MNLKTKGRFAGVLAACFGFAQRFGNAQQSGGLILCGYIR